MKKLAILLSVAAISAVLMTGCNQTDAPADGQITPVEQGDKITRAEASALALTNLGISKTDTEYTVVTESTNSELPCYDVEILVEGVVYKYRIDASRGDLLKVTVNDQEVAIDKVPGAISSPNSQYISLEEAKRIALEDAGITEADLTEFEHEMDYALGKYLFELEFGTSTHEYEYEIDANDGSIFKKDVDGTTLVAPSAPNGSSAPAEYISAEEAENAALGHAGVERSAAVFDRTQWELSKGTAIYEVEFTSAGVEYEYDVNALTGAIISYEKDGRSFEEQENASYISNSDALKAALAHAGLREEDLEEVSIEPDVENGRTVYEIEFSNGGYEYEYIIDATNGEILESEKDED